MRADQKVSARPRVPAPEVVEYDNGQARLADGTQVRTSQIRPAHDAELAFSLAGVAMPQTAEAPMPPKPPAA